ncbi:MAG: DUF4136 domain-containing protein [Cyclobacteriaceae bacterium]|nr:DUF4136 domain-containing protein [Cyclobacteriaceae bacterium]
MKFPVHLLLLALITSIMTDCAPRVKSHAVKEKGVDLAQYKSYTWAKPGDEEYQRTYDKKEAIGYIIQLTDAELKNKGFIKTPDQPDAIFIVDTKLEEHVAYTKMPGPNDGFGAGVPVYTGGSYGGFSMGYYGPVQASQTVEREFLQGTILLEMYDSKTNQLLWRSWTEEQITNNTDLDKAIRKTVKKLVGQMPVKH